MVKKLFALCVSVIALVVAGIGIMNIMLVSAERKKIGIRKAIGATKKDILTQFWMEVIFLSEFGGIVGIIMGVAGGNKGCSYFNIPAVIPIGLGNDWISSLFCYRYWLWDLPSLASCTIRSIESLKSLNKGSINKTYLSVLLVRVSVLCINMNIGIIPARLDSKRFPKKY